MLLLTSLRIRYFVVPSTVCPQNYIMWYTTWTWVTTTSILPFLILLALNIIIYRRLKEARAVQVSARLNSGQHQSQVRPLR